MGDNLKKIKEEIDKGDDNLDVNILISISHYLNAKNLCDRKIPEYIEASSKLSNCYFKIEEFKKSNELDMDILEINPKHKKALERSVNFYILKDNYKDFNKGVELFSTLKLNYPDDFSLGKYENFVQIIREKEIKLQENSNHNEDEQNFLLSNNSVSQIKNNNQKSCWDKICYYLCCKFCKKKK